MLTGRKMEIKKDKEMLQEKIIFYLDTSTRWQVLVESHKSIVSMIKLYQKTKLSGEYAENVFSRSCPKKYAPAKEI